MTVTFGALKNEYLATAAHASLSSPSEQEKLTRLARALLAGQAEFYEPVMYRTGVPILWLMVINERESGGRFDTYLGNGDPLRSITTHVPKGRGPFKTWADGAADGIVYDHVGAVGPDGWSLPWFLYQCEKWNGFGPRYRGKRSGYLWAGSTVYTGGKYVADGVWSPAAWDSQPGCWPLAKVLLDLDPKLRYGLTADFDINGGSYVPVYVVKDNVPADIPALTGIKWIQNSLNRIMAAGLVVDGSDGRHTHAAIRKFQVLHGLSPDGQAGDLTCAAIDAELAKLPAPVNPPKGPTMDIINQLGDALGNDGPHTAASIAATMPHVKQDELITALETVAINMLPLPAASATGGAPVSQIGSAALHAVTGIGGVLLSSGLFDPAGPLAGLAHAYPAFGLVLAILGPLANYFVVRAANAEK